MIDLERFHKMHLPSGQQKERFSLAYISALAAHAGFWVEEPKVDLDSVDGVIKSRLQNRGGQITFQAKATSENSFDSNNNLLFPLKINNYNDLRDDQAILKSILIVMLLPTNVPDWLCLNEDDALLKYNSYWICLKGYPPTNNTSTVTITIPKANKLTPQKLEEMMTEALSGGGST